jgi:hypothetical protein
VNGQRNANQGAPYPQFWGQPVGPQPLGTVYIGFEGMGNHAPQATAPVPPAGVHFSTAQHAGYCTAQNARAQNAGGQPQAGQSRAAASDKPKRSPNTLGLVGFVVSLCGLATAALPVAVAGGALSSLALFRRGRFLALVGLVMALGNPAVIETMHHYHPTGKANSASQRVTQRLLHQHLGQVNQTLSQAEALVVAHYEANDNTWPDGIQGNVLVAGLKDPWDKPIRFDEMGDRLVLRSLGPDGQAETKDDIVLTLHHFRQPASQSMDETAGDQTTVSTSSDAQH